MARRKKGKTTQSNSRIMSITMTDLSLDVLLQLDEYIDKALNACGAQAASFAAIHATEKGVVDTGLLRNSLTWAMGGGIPNIRAYHAEYGANKYKDEEGKTKRRHSSDVQAGSVKVGRYEGQAPEDRKGERTVYIGTNVEYAVYNELGTVKMKARPFLKPALSRHITEYRQIITAILSKVGK